ncbi:MAG: DUF433 domain-containing protein [Bacteroidota bacterium]
MNWQEHIESNPKIMFGKPVIKGTRIPVDLILEKLALGETTEQVLTAYPHLTAAHLQACFAFAAASVRNELVLP